MTYLSLTPILPKPNMLTTTFQDPGTNFATLSNMARLPIQHIIQSDKAKTVEQASEIIKHLRNSQISRFEILELDFTGITRTSSMFIDRLVKALATYFGPSYPNLLRLSGLEATNPMLPLLWESAIDKFRHTQDSFAAA